MYADEAVVDGKLSFGELSRLSLEDGQEAQISLAPSKGFDFGAGKGKRVSRLVKGGVVGLILDARGRPLIFAQDEATHGVQLQAWNTAVELYPEDAGA